MDRISMDSEHKNLQKISINYDSRNELNGINNSSDMVMVEHSPETRSRGRSPSQPN